MLAPSSRSCEILDSRFCSRCLYRQEQEQYLLHRTVLRRKQNRARGAGHSPGQTPSAPAATIQMAERNGLSLLLRVLTILKGSTAIFRHVLQVQDIPHALVPEAAADSVSLICADPNIANQKF